MGTPSRRLKGWRGAAAGSHLVVSLAAGGVVGAALAPVLGGLAAGLLAWPVTAGVFLGRTWGSIWSLDGPDTAWRALRQDGARPVRDLTLLAISVATLVTVVVVIFRARQNPPQLTALGVTAIAASWLVLNTTFVTHYARLYYGEPRGGIDFNADSDTTDNATYEPTYKDFAYLAFTIGMTFQVSDTVLRRTPIRTTALRQALLSFVFNTVILAVTVNVVAGLSG